MENAYSFGQEIHLYTHEEIDTKKLVNHLLENGVSKVEIRRDKPNIEDCFMDLMVSGNLTEEEKNA